MKLKTLFLGSAAVLAVGGVAQAADFTVAEPVSYVKICDAFGTGYWYIPGTDTCIRIQGHVLVDVNIHENDSVVTNDQHSAAWDITSEGQLAFTVKTMTEHGDLTGVVRLTGLSDNSADDGDPGTYNTVMDRIWFQLGKFKAGYDNSIFNNKGVFVGTGYNGSDTVDEFSLNWTAGGYGFAIGVGDPRDRWGSHLPGNYWMPEVVAAATVRGTWGDAKLSGGIVQVDDDPDNGIVGPGSMLVWGAALGATIKADHINKGDQFVIAGNIGTGGCFVSDASNCGGTTDGELNWSVIAGFKHIINSMWQTNISGSYLHNGGTYNGGSRWSAAANLVWEPVDDFTVDARVVYTRTLAGSGTAVDADSWTGRLRFQYEW